MLYQLSYLGQASVLEAAELYLTGIVLVKQAACAVTGIPLKFLGTGEKLDALETYDPVRSASRILGMGDIIGLIERAEGGTDCEHAKLQAGRMRAGTLDLEDWLSQLRQMRKTGALRQVAEVLPGRLGQAASHAEPEELDRGLRTSEAIICSMTGAERHDPELLNASRRRRIASGSSTDVQEVNRLIKHFRQAQKPLKSMKGASPRELMGLFG